MTARRPQPTRRAMTFEDFERTAREMFDEIPPDLRGGVEYLVVSRDTVPHPELPEIFTLGECATGEYDMGVDAPGTVRSGVHLYYGSFRALAGLHDDFDWEGELWETLTHEVMHHRESTAGEDALEDLDYAEDENFKRREGLPFDPFFYRMGAPVADRYCLPNTRFLLHQPAGGVGGTAADIAIEAEEIIRMRERINRIFSDQTGQPIEKIESDTRRNFWLDANAAKEYGLVGKIVRSIDDVG